MSHDLSICFLNVIYSEVPPVIDLNSVQSCDSFRRMVHGGHRTRKGWTMSDHLKQTIADLETKLADQLAEVAKTRDTINRVSELAGLPLPYPEAAEPKRPAGGPIRPDQFYGQPLHTAMRSFLEGRRHPGPGPATVNEIYAALTAGGYQFDTKSEDNSKRVIRITLTKNSLVFHKLPNGSYGLLAWYPSAKKPKKSGAATSVEGSENEAGEPDQDDTTAAEEADA